MAQRNVEWYSVHTNGLALREMAQRNVECYSVDTNSVALCRIALQNIRRSIWTLNCFVLLEIFRSSGELSSLLVAWREGCLLHYAESFHATLHHLGVRCTIRHYVEPFHAALHHLGVRCTKWTVIGLEKVVPPSWPIGQKLTTYCEQTIVPYDKERQKAISIMLWGKVISRPRLLGLWLGSPGKEGWFLGAKILFSICFLSKSRQPRGFHHYPMCKSRYFA